MLILPAEATQSRRSVCGLKDWDRNRQTSYVLRLHSLHPEQRSIADRFHKAIAQCINGPTFRGVFPAQHSFFDAGIDRPILYDRASGMFHEIPACIEVPGTGLKYSTAPAADGNVVTICA